MNAGDVLNLDGPSKSDGKTSEEKVVNLDNKRSTLIRPRKSLYRTRSKAAVREYEVDH